MLGTLFLPFFYFTPCAVFDDQPDSLHIVPKIVVRLCDLFVCSSEWMILFSLFVLHIFACSCLFRFLFVMDCWWNFAIPLLFRFSPRSVGLSSSIYCAFQMTLASRFTFYSAPAAQHCIVAVSSSCSDFLLSNVKQVASLMLFAVDAAAAAVSVMLQVEKISSTSVFAWCDSWSWYALLCAPSLDLPVALLLSQLACSRRCCSFIPDVSVVPLHVVVVILTVELFPFLCYCCCCCCCCRLPSVSCSSR